MNAGKVFMRFPGGVEKTLTEVIGMKLVSVEEVE